MSDIIKVPMYIIGGSGTSADSAHLIAEILTGTVSMDFGAINQSAVASATASLPGLRPGMKVFFTGQNGSSAFASSTRAAIMNVITFQDGLSATAQNFFSAAGAAGATQYDILAIRTS